MTEFGIHAELIVFALSKRKKKCLALPHTVLLLPVYRAHNINPNAIAIHYIRYTYKLLMLCCF